MSVPPSPNRPFPYRGDSHDARLAAVESQMSHVYDTTTKVAQQQAAMQSTLETIIPTLREVSQRQNTPNQTNWWGMISSLVALVLVLAGGVTMRISPLEASINDNRARIQINQDHLITHAYEQGKVDTLLDEHKAAVSKLENYALRLSSKQHKTAEQVSALSANAETLSNHIKQVDNEGSRKWASTQQP